MAQGDWTARLWSLFLSAESTGKFTAVGDTHVSVCIICGEHMGCLCGPGPLWEC